MIFYISFASLLLTLHKRSSRFCTSTFCTSKVYKTDISLSRNFEEKKCPWGSLQKINSVKMCKFFPPIVPPESVFRTFLYLSKLSRRCQLTPIQFLFQDFGLGLLCCLPSRCWCWSGSRQSWRGTSGRSRPGSAPPFLTHGWPK